jgi:hypothetical protein
MNPEQLDLFTHSRPVMLRNDLVQALRTRGLIAGREVHAKLAAEFPQDTLLAPGARLLDRLAWMEKPLPLFSTHQETQDAILQAESMLTDALTIFCAPKADDWMAPVWQKLADACGRLAYHRDFPDAHSAALLMRGRHWAAAKAAIAHIPAWRRIPEPLAWMAETCFRLEGLDAAWPFLVELAWRAPTRCAALLRHLDAAPRLVREFACEFADDDADFAWFPAWALLVDPNLSAGLCRERTPEYSPPEQAVWTLRHLQKLEREGSHHEIVEQRKTLRALHPELFARYMRTRA